MWSTERSYSDSGTYDLHGPVSATCLLICALPSCRSIVVALPSVYARLLFAVSIACPGALRRAQHSPPKSSPQEDGAPRKKMRIDGYAARVAATVVVGSHSAQLPPVRATPFCAHRCSALAVCCGNVKPLNDHLLDQFLRTCSVPCTQREAWAAHTGCRRARCLVC